MSRSKVGELDQNPPIGSAIFQVLGDIWTAVPAQWTQEKGVFSQVTKQKEAMER